MACSRLKIVFQGEPGANAHLACREAYPQHLAVPCATFEDAFAAVASGESALGMMPIDNSVGGRVADIHCLMPVTGVHIVAEWFLPVSYQLVAPAGALLTDIRSVESHVMALERCRNVISRLKLEPIIAADAAGSARKVAELGDHSRAAIATRLAAEVYGLEVLAENIEDEAPNITRFIVVASQPCWPCAVDARVLTTFVFRVRNLPAALYKALGGFATNGVNMTKLESYMVEGNFFATQFYADVEGHPHHPSLALALEELAFFSTELQILGVYQAHAFRVGFSGKISGRSRTLGDGDWHCA
jgi:prephenate dehydratase